MGMNHHWFHVAGYVWVGIAWFFVFAFAVSLCRAASHGDEANYRCPCCDPECTFKLEEAIDNSEEYAETR